MELQHHGIKGMKWGVRRFQNADGTLTSAGERRYSDDGNGHYKKIKSEHRIKLEDRYKKSGMSEETAKKAAERRIRTEKVIAAIAGVTVAAAAAYLVTKEVKDRTDHIIHAGDTLQRMTQHPDEDLSNRAFYAAYNPKDKIRYAGMLGKQHFRGVNVHKSTIAASRDVRIASRKKAADAFADLYEHDEEFRNAFSKSNSMFRGIGSDKLQRAVNAASGKMSSRVLRSKGYDAFNFGLVNHDPNGQLVSKKFYDKLKAMGYDAIMDINDQKYSGYNAKAPVIVFNSAKTRVQSSSKMDSNAIDKAYDAARNLMISEERTRQLKELGVKTVAGSLGLTALSSARTTAAINNYRREHPNSTMSDKDIYVMLSKQK